MSDKSIEFGNFYVVATPIGNLEDMTFRAVRILQEVDFIFAEDTRTTRNLLEAYQISPKNTLGENKLISYNSQNQNKRNAELLLKLAEGKNVALVADAGTPGVSDPGYSAVLSVRKYLQENFKEDAEAQNKIFAVPGASALTAFLSVVGAGTHAFTFYGFLPHKNGRQKALRKMLENENSSVFYESTYRLKKCLEEIIKLQSGGGVAAAAPHTPRKLVVGKEITKIHENYFYGTAEEILQIFKKDPQKLKGEFVVMIV